jgi:hypothetical protein
LSCFIIQLAIQIIDVLSIQPEKQKSQNSKKRLEGPSIVFESRISELEAQLTQTKMDLRKALEEADLYKKKLADHPLSFETHSPLNAAGCDSHQQQIESLQKLVERKLFSALILYMLPICLSIFSFLI